MADEIITGQYTKESRAKAYLRSAIEAIDEFYCVDIDKGESQEMRCARAARYAQKAIEILTNN